MKAIARYPVLLVPPLAVLLGFALLGASAGAEEKSSDRVVATVDGENIYRSEVEDARRFLAPEARAYPMASISCSRIWSIPSSPRMRPSGWGWAGRRRSSAVSPVSPSAS